MTTTLCLRNNADIERALLALPSVTAELPASPTRSWLARAAATWHAWSQRSRGRMQLAELDERMLADIGLTRADVAHEVAKPFWR